MHEIYGALLYNMYRTKIYWDDLGVTAEISAFNEDKMNAEFHVMLHVNPNEELFDGQIKRIYSAEERLLSIDLFNNATVVCKRYFLSDSTNQQPLMDVQNDCAVSIIQQSPLDGSKVAVWLYLQRGTQMHNEDGMIVVERNGYRHLWMTGLYEAEGNSAEQTTAMLNKYEQMLKKYDATLADNCIRTWFYVRDVDTQYKGMVVARKQNFVEQGLTEHTHYIASTGIGGLPAITSALVQLDTYAMTSFTPSQQRYLYAPTHLNPTYEYGVTFERGTVMEYGDRAHVIISGTASINNKGEVVHVGDIVKQTERMWENVDTLLAEGDASFDDVMQIIVYLRDMADYKRMKTMFEERFPDIPTVFTLAPVCRPTWLIEMECIAVAPRNNPQFKNF